MSTRKPDHGFIRWVEFGKCYKKQGCVGEILFEKTPGAGNFRFLTLPQESLDQARLHPRKLHKVVIPLGNKAWNQDPWKFHMIIFLITPGNSMLFLINPWKFYLLFLQFPWKFHHVFTQFVFFWISSINNLVCGLNVKLAPFI